MEYKMVIMERRDYYEVTSYHGRERPSSSWEKLDLEEVERDSLEKMIIGSALEIAQKSGKRRTKVTIKVTQ